MLTHDRAMRRLSIAVLMHGLAHVGIGPSESHFVRTAPSERNAPLSLERACTVMMRLKPGAESGARLP